MGANPEQQRGSKLVGARLTVTGTGSSAAVTVQLDPADPPEGACGRADVVAGRKHEEGEEEPFEDAILHDRSSRLSRLHLGAAEPKARAPDCV